MKKLLFISLAAVVCALSFSCSKNSTQQQKEEEQKKDETPAAVQLTFTYYATQDMLDMMDIQVIYNDGTGDKTETGTSLEWTKTVTANLPVTFKFDRKVTKKEGAEFLADKNYSYTKNIRISHKILNSKGEFIRGGDKTIGSVSGPSKLSGDKILLLLNENRMDSAHSYDFDKDGKCPQLDIPENE